MTHWVYHLYFIENGHKHIFYVGIANDCERRLKEHQRSRGKSLVKRFIQRLTEDNIEIGMDVQREMKYPDDEEMEILNMKGMGHVLVNSKNGDSDSRRVIQVDDTKYNWEDCLVLIEDLMPTRIWESYGKAKDKTSVVEVKGLKFKRKIMKTYKTCSVERGGITYVSTLDCTNWKSVYEHLLEQIESVC